MRPGTISTLSMPGTERAPVRRKVPSMRTSRCRSRCCPTSMRMPTTTGRRSSPFRLPLLSPREVRSTCVWPRSAIRLSKVLRSIRRISFVSLSDAASPSSKRRPYHTTTMPEGEQVVLAQGFDECLSGLDYMSDIGHLAYVTVRPMTLRRAGAFREP